MDEIVVAAGEAGDFFEGNVKVGFEELVDEFSVLGFDGVGVWGCR